MNTLPVTGKGVYIWQPKNIGTPEYVADLLEQSGTDFVAVKIHNGTLLYDDLRDYVEAIRARGIRVGAWGYIYLKWSPLKEAEVAAQACALYQPEFYLIDAEAYAKLQWFGAKLFANRLRALLPKMPMGLNSYWKPSYHPTLPWKELRSISDFDCPQVYWRGYNPVGKLVESKGEYAAMSPKLPYAMAGGDMYFEHNLEPTPQQVVDFLGAVKKDPEIKAVVMWSLDQHKIVPELWNAYSQFSWDTGEVELPPDEPLPLKYAFVNVYALSVRPVPGTYEGPVRFLKRNDPVTIYKMIGDWTQINPAGTEFVHAFYLTETPMPLYAAVVTAYALSVRSGPGTSNAILRYLVKGDRVDVWQEVNGWAKIQADKKEYVSVYYLVQL